MTSLVKAPGGQQRAYLLRVFHSPLTEAAASSLQLTIRLALLKKAEQRPTSCIIYG